MFCADTLHLWSGMSRENMHKQKATRS